MNFIKAENSKWTAVLIFAVAFVYQLFCIKRGFDLTDEGFLMSLYQFFGENPASCPGGAGYPLSCYLGWLVNSVWPGGGVLWINFIGIIIVTATMYVSYKIVSKLFYSRIALLALLLQLIFLTTDPKPFGYNNLTAFNYVCVVGLIVRAERSRRIAPLVFAGLLAGVGVYLRLPNLAFLGLCILPLVGSGINWKGILRSLAFFVCFIGGIAGGWLIMKAIGADSLILGFFSTLGGTLDGESTHSSGAMISTYLGNYLGSLKQIIIVGGGIFCVSLVLIHKKLYWPLIAIPLWMLYREFYIDSGDLNYTTIMLYNGIGVLGCCLAFTKNKKDNVIPAAALLFSILAPLGSDRGFTTMWVGTWLALPVGMIMIVHRLEKDCQKYKTASIICAAMILTTGFLSSMRHAYYECGSRFSKTAKIESIYAKGIKTKPENAKIINEVLGELGRLGVKERDTLLVFDSSPMFYFLTRTHSFDGVYWPCVQYGRQWVNTLIKAAADNPCPKVVVIQKFFNLGQRDGWEEPDESYTNVKKNGAMATKEMKLAVFEFLDGFHYSKVWTNEYYDIYVL